MSRRVLDAYLTPDWATKALLRVHPEIGGRLLLDPCSGDGRMVMVLSASGRFAAAFTNDIDPSRQADQHTDACAEAVWVRRPCWVISNPPFNAAGDIVWQAIRQARVGVAMLLRATFGEPCGPSSQAPRNGRLWLKTHPPKAVVMLPRISFTGDGKTDSAPCWWFLWGEVTPGIVVVTREMGAGQLPLLGGAHVHA